MACTFHYEDEEGETHGREVYMASEQSQVLGPDGEPQRKSRQHRLGFDLTPRKRPERKTGRWP